MRFAAEIRKANFFVAKKIRDSGETKRQIENLQRIKSA